jgi:hypothetical protein
MQNNIIIKEYYIGSITTRTYKEHYNTLPDIQTQKMLLAPG